MSRWIDAEHVLYRMLCCGTYHGVIAFDTVKNVINDAPSIDIVRCRECKHGEYREDFGDYLCGQSGLGVVNDADFFCSDGKMKGADDE